jgi:hypothetical protein
MATINERDCWETFVRRPGELTEGAEIPLVIRDLRAGRKKYRMRHVVATISRDARELARMDTLYVRTVVGVRLAEPWGIKILRDLPIEISGEPYQDFFAALRSAGKKG